MANLFSFDSTTTNNGGFTFDFSGTDASSTTTNGGGGVGGFHFGNIGDEFKVAFEGEGGGGAFGFQGFGVDAAAAAPAGGGFGGWGEWNTGLGGGGGGGGGFNFGFDLGGGVHSDDFQTDFQIPIPHTDIDRRAPELKKLEADSWHTLHPHTSQQTTSTTITSSVLSSSTSSSIDGPNDAALASICELHFRHLVVRTLNQYESLSSSNLFGSSETLMGQTGIQANVVILLSQFADALAQCYLTMVYETSSAAVADSLADQPIKNGLLRYSHEQMAAGQLRYKQNGGDWNQTTHITRTLVQRWLTRVQTSRPDSSGSSASIPSPFSSSSPPVAVGELDEVGLAIFVQTGLECLLYQLSQFHRTIIDVLALWHLLKQNKVYRAVWRALQCEFKLIPANQPPSWIPLAVYQQQPKPFDSFEVAFKLATATVQVDMNQLNQSSWYMQPEKLSHYAKQFASGELKVSDCPLSKELAELGIRPLQSHGRLPSNILTPPRSFQYPFAQAMSDAGFASFILTDATGREFRFIYGRDHNDPFCLVWNFVTGGVVCQAAKNQTGCVQNRIGITCDLQVDFIDDIIGCFMIHEIQFQLTPVQQKYTQHLMQLDEAKQHFYQQFRLERDQTNQRDSKSTLLELSACGPIRYGSSAEAPFFEKPSLFELSANKAIVDATHKWRIKSLEQIFERLMPLTFFSQFGPTLYEDNQPFKIKRQFHSHFIDACLTADGLTPLPKVLNELISDYYMIPIPFIPSEAKEQMGAYDSLSTATGLYPGHNSNPVECHPFSFGTTYQWNSSDSCVIESNAAPFNSSAAVGQRDWHQMDDDVPDQDEKAICTYCDGHHHSSECDVADGGGELFRGDGFCLSALLPRPELDELIRSHGGRIVGSPESAGCTYVLSNQPVMGSVVPVVSESWLLDSIRSGTKLPWVKNTD